MLTSLFSPVYDTGECHRFLHRGRAINQYDAIESHAYSLGRGNMICLKFVLLVLPCLVLFNTQLKMVGIY